VQAIAGLPVGEVFSPEDVQRSANRLRRTGAFRSVVLEEDAQISSNDTLGITAVVVEERPRRLAVSGSVASLDGVSFGLSGTHRNLFGGAERVILAAEARRLGIEAGALDYTLSAKFERPATFSPDTTFALGITFDRAREAQTTNDALNLSASLTHYFSDTLTGTGGVAYGISRAEDPSGITFFRTLSLPINLAWDTRNFKKTASDGVYMLADIKPSVGFGAAESGTRIAFDARGYKGVTPSDSLVLAARLRFGVILGSSLAGTPREDLFYSGGPATVRGQPYQSLGVQELRDDTGAAFETGGTHYLGASIEARQRLSQTLGMVGFVDLGRIDAGGYFNTSDNWHAGAGLGLRYMTAIGPVRLDVAGPVAGSTGDGLQLYIGIGQSF
jgi:translocation and assembly module TamA